MRWIKMDFVLYLDKISGLPVLGKKIELLGIDGPSPP